MYAHPDFVDVDLPRTASLGAHRLTPLSPKYVDEDLEAVLATAPLLKGLFGSWPEGLSREENLIDLAWHDKDFVLGRSFSWIVRDDEGAYIGCFYLFPSLGSRGQATAVLWLCGIPARARTARNVQSTLTSWLSEKLPSGYEIVWSTRPILE